MKQTIFVTPENIQCLQYMFTRYHAANCHENHSENLRENHCENLRENHNENLRENCAKIMHAFCL